MEKSKGKETMEINIETIIKNEIIIMKTEIATTIIEINGRTTTIGEKIGHTRGILIKDT